MNQKLLSLVFIAFAWAFVSPASAEIIARPQAGAAQPPARAVEAQPAAAGAAAANADAARFAATLQQALGFLAKADHYLVNVTAQWKGTGDAALQQGESHYQLLVQGEKQRVTVQSAGATGPNLLYVCDGKQTTTFLPARAMYSQHAVDSPEATLESNTMLSLSLAGSAIDVLLQPNVGQFVQSQATGVKYHGLQALPDGQAHHFELQWAGAKVELWLAAQGDPLLKQFTRTSVVPTGDKTKYEMVHTARFAWQINGPLSPDAFTLSLPAGAHRVNEIYDALSGDEPASRINKPLPKIQLTRLDGQTFNVAVPAGKRGAILIFWATWCSPSVNEMPAVSEFVKAYAERGLDFYAINVGEQPAEVRRFTAKSPLVSSIVLDPQGKASAALRVTELPAVVVVNPDNTVRAIFHGTVKEIQNELAKDLQAMLGASAATARLPDGSQPAPK
jgi:thiol-disulfide isomerase/thioredoxin